MRILQVITRSCLGGAQSVVVNIANELCRAGHEVIVAAGTDDGQMWPLLDSNVRQVECRHLVRPLSPRHDLQAVFGLRSIYRKFRPDVVHLHSSKAGMLGRMAFPPGRTVYTVHGFDSIRLAFRKLLPVERLMQHRCAAILGVSRYDEENLRAEGIRHNTGFVYNGIPAPKEQEDVRWNIPSKFRKTVLCIARLSPPKKSGLFLQTARMLPEYAFVWIGNQHPVEDTPQNVFFLGNIPDAARHNRLADLFILPSNYEGLPMVLLEAMSHGVPAVASDVGGVREVIGDGIAGYAVENTPEAFAARISEVLGNDELHGRLSRNARQRFDELFTVDRMVDGYMEVYRNIKKLQP